MESSFYSKCSAMSGTSNNLIVQKIKKYPQFSYTPPIFSEIALKYTIHYRGERCPLIDQNWTLFFQLFQIIQFINNT